MTGDASAHGPRLEELSLEECLEHLRRGSVGRIAVEVVGGPVIVPVNYRLVEAPGSTWIALRTRAGNVVDRASKVAFEIDAVEHTHHEGWSVLVRGTLHHVDPDAADFAEQFDPEPWLFEDRDSWLVIEPFAITGRRLHGGERDWAFVADAYL